MHAEIERLEDQFKNILQHIEQLYAGCSGKGEHPNCMLCQTSREQKLACADKTQTALGAVLASVFDYFVRQEALMKNPCIDYHRSEHCNLHMESHADISERVQRLIHASKDLQASEIIARLMHEIRELLIQHRTLFDKPFYNIIRFPL